MEWQELNAEIAGDPLQLGYAPLVQRGSDQGVADRLNEAGNYPVALRYRTKGQFLLAIAPSVLGMAALPEAVQRKWDRMLSLIAATDLVEVGNPGLAALFDLAIQDGVMTPQQKDSLLARPGSRAEALWGEGTNVSAADVARALRGA